MTHGCGKTRRSLLVPRLASSALAVVVLAGAASIAAAQDPAAVAEPAGKEAAENPVPGQTGDEFTAEEIAELQRILTVAGSLRYQTGHVELGDMASADLSEGYVYLSAEDADKVLSEIWSNPPGIPQLGMILPAGQDILADDAWAVVVSFDDTGYISDDDADEIDYDELLENIHDAEPEDNAARQQAGYPPMHVAGWAETPHYDAERNILFWAKDLEVEGAHSLNYDVRVLGRRGVLSLNAVASLDQIGMIRPAMEDIRGLVGFDQGHRYAEFNPNIDRAATFGLAALVAGGAAAKSGVLKGLLAVLIAGKKVIVVGIAGAAAAVKRMLGMRSKNDSGEA